MANVEDEKFRLCAFNVGLQCVEPQKEKMVNLKTGYVHEIRFCEGVEGCVGAVIVSNLRQASEKRKKLGIK